MDAHECTEITQRIRSEIGKVIVGQELLVRDAILCLLCEGHLLIEGVPGLGKTMLATSLADVAGLDWGRLQFTPDLMPADVVGTRVLDTGDGGRGFRFEPGPVFNGLLLADEINRATPKTQAALLEAMAERHVTAGGETRPLPRPFLVLATQNPLEQEGTYPLPEAQLDRFLLKSNVEMPSADELVTILDRTTGAITTSCDQVTTDQHLRDMIALTRSVPIPSHVVRYACDLVVNSHPGGNAPDLVKNYVRFGASPRGAQALTLAAKATALMDGRPSASVEDVQSVVQPALRHRIGLDFHATVDGVGTDHVVASLIESTPVQLDAS